ncbi:hypothetical protein EV122DRAFT_218470 [Schizophyllum commune]
MGEAALQSPPHDPEGARQYAPTSGTPYRPANTYRSPITPLTTYDATLHGETPDNDILSYSLYCTPAATTAPSSSTASSLPQAPRGFVDETTDCRPIPRMRRVKRSAEDKLKDVLDVLSDNDIPLITVILAILRPATPTYETYRNRFFNLDNINRLLEALYENRRGKECMDEWVRKRAVDVVCESVYQEMEGAKDELRTQSSQVTADSLKIWSLSGLTNSLRTPTFTAVLKAATENRKAIEKNIVRMPTIAQQIIALQVHHVRSQQSAQVQHILAIYFWAAGCPRQMIEFLSRCSLSTSYTTTLEVIDQLSKGSLTRAKQVVERGPHAVGYDNVNMSMSEHVEQRPGAPPKVQSGTFGMIYQLRGNPRRTDMLLAPLEKNLETAGDLSLADITPTLAQSRAVLHQLKIIVVRALTSYNAAFADYAEYPTLQHQPRRPLSHTETNVFHPLPIVTIGEGSIEGNLDYQEYLYLDHGQLRRTGDINAFTTRRIFQLGFGLFHMLMNLIWGIRKTHYGTMKQIGSLSYFFNIVIDKVRLANDRPDFHTLLAALQQVRDGILLEAWRRECGADSLDAFARSQPMETELLAVAERILLNYATPVDPSDLDRRPDPAHENIRLLLRDLIYVAELTQAIADGDFGRIEDLLPDIARLFRGAGYNNYSTEMLHFLYNLKKVWTPEFAYVVQFNPDSSASVTLITGTSCGITCL